MKIDKPGPERNCFSDNNGGGPGRSFPFKIGGLEGAFNGVLTTLIPLQPRYLLPPTLKQ